MVRKAQLGQFNLEKKMLLGNFIGAFQYTKVAYMKDGETFNQAYGNRQGGKRNFLLWGWGGTGTGCLEKLWMPHCWKCSRSGWMELWATWCNRYPFPWHQGWTGWSWKVLFNPNHSIFLWFLCLRLSSTIYALLILFLSTANNDTL